MSNIPDAIKLKTLRKSHGLKMTRMAEILGIEISAYSMMENGKRDITMDVMNAIFRELKIDPTFYIHEFPEKFVEVFRDGENNSN